MDMKEVLRGYVIGALEATGGRATIVQVARHIWDNHEQDLRRMGDWFYTWQYDMRWIAYELRKEGMLKGSSQSPRGVWELA